MNTAKVSDFIEHLQKLEPQTTSIEVDENKTLLLGMSKTDAGVMVCQMVDNQTLGEQITLTIDDDIERLVTFCFNNAISRFDDGSSSGLSEDTIRLILNSVAMTFKDTVDTYLAGVLMNLINDTQKPLVWTFNGVTIVSKIVDDNLEITSDSKNEYCSIVVFPSDEPILNVVAFMIQCTVTGKNPDGTFKSSQAEIFNKVNGILNSLK